MSSSELQKHILATLAYYDVMDYPMTSFEIHKYLMAGNNQESGSKDQYEVLSIINELEDQKLKRFIEEFRGFYFLKGRKDLVEQRIERNKIAEVKYKKLLKVVRWLRFVPFVRMVGVTGRLAMKNTELSSDLDVLIILKHGRIFTSRMLATAMVQLLGKRRYGQKIADRVCLNYFITTDSLEINLKDAFSAHEYFWMLPVFGFKVFHKFRRHNAWIKNFRPNYQENEIKNNKLLKDTHLTKGVRKTGEKIFGWDFLEKALKKYQLKKIEANPLTKKQGSLIIANDEMLVFLPEPQGPKIFEAFQNRLEKLR